MVDTLTLMTSIIVLIADSNRVIRFALATGLLERRCNLAGPLALVSSRLIFIET
jgi:hypothetical protein